MLYERVVRETQAALLKELENTPEEIERSIFRVVDAVLEAASKGHTSLTGTVSDETAQYLIPWFRVRRFTVDGIKMTNMRYTVSFTIKWTL